MKNKTTLLAIISFSFLCLGTSTGQVVLDLSTATLAGHNTQGAGGIASLYDDNDDGGSSNFTKPDPNDPSSWTASGQAWPNDWQGLDPLSGATNNKVGWVTFNFGSVEQLQDLYIWNVSEASGQNRRVNTYNIYYTNSPTVTPVSGSGSGNSVDYNFASGGWTQLGATRSLLQWADGTGPDGSEALNVSAQYIGLEFITYEGDTQRVGLNEVVFTGVPEPSSLALLGLGLSALLFRRKR